MSSLKVILPTVEAAAREPLTADGRALEDMPKDDLAELLRATTKQSTEAASCTLIRNWVGAAQADFFWLPLDPAALPPAPVPPLFGLVQVALKQDQLVSEPSAPDEMHRVWIGVAIPLHCDGRTVAVLACRIAAERWTQPGCRQRLDAAMFLVETHLCSLHVVEDLRGSVRRLEQAERLQRALVAIADQASADREMPEVYRALHGIVASLMYAENFYIA